MIREAINSLKDQPLMGWISVVGTALCLLLVMMITIIGDLAEPAYAPESNRSRLLYDDNITLTDGNQVRSSALGRTTVDRLYGNLPSAEMVSVIGSWFESTDIEADGTEMLTVDSREVDSNYWRVFDHTVRAGSTISEEDVNAGEDVAVLSESLAKKFFGSNEAAIGKTVRISRKPYRVKGVVADVSPLMNLSYAQVWTAIGKPKAAKEVSKAKIKDFTGHYAVVILCKPDKVEEVKREAQSNLYAFNKELDAMGGWKRQDGEDKPYDIGHLKADASSSDYDGLRKMWMILIGVFIIIPAINLSSMTQGRLARRRHEIGVRRAFGATRMGIMMEILKENFVLTLIGGVIGLVLCYVFIYLFAGSLFDMGWSRPMAEVFMPLGAMMNWKIFAMSLLICFVLNLLSSGVPAFRASRVNPVEAINNKE